MLRSDPATSSKWWHHVVTFVSHTSNNQQNTLPYLALSVWPGADPGVQAVSQPTGDFKSCPGSMLSWLSSRPSQLKNATVLWPVPSDTAWWQRHDWHEQVVYKANNQIFVCLVPVGDNSSTRTRGFAQYLTKHISSEHELLSQGLPKPRMPGSIRTDWWLETVTQSIVCAQTAPGVGQSV